VAEKNRNTFAEELKNATEQESIGILAEDEKKT
jgi:hypothetical protein